jgi:3-deoxy-manno-octulosonate cytidylyltransferase (CMP-KDO synthetase)
VATGAVPFHTVIPARFGSTRLPGKALLPLAGKPMLQWVYEKARAAGGAVCIATDDERIAAAARGFGAEVVMTAVTHASGTDRVAEVARRLGLGDDTIVVNAQGDEPLLPPGLVQQVAGMLASDPRADMATLAEPITDLATFLDPNAVKVVCDLAGRALYFSRAPIPWARDGARGGFTSQSRWAGARRHIGLYAYRAGALQRMAALAPTSLEQAEQLEQLRALEHGFDIRVAEPCEAPGPDVNTPADLERVNALLAR